MKPADWDSWLRGWLSRHPLKNPPAHLLERFSQEVLARIRPREAPAPVFRPRWTVQPRWGLAWSGALAVALCLAVLASGPTDRPSQEAEILGLWEELEEAGEAPPPEELSSDEEMLEELLWWDEQELTVS